MASTAKTLLASGIAIVADDLGLTPATNTGIAYCLKHGLISGAALMANGMAFADAVERIKTLPPFQLGLHLVLVEEPPLTARQPFARDHRIFFIKYLFGRIKLAALEQELRAQIERGLAAGLRPVFLNSHQHLHLLPGVLAIMIKLAREYRIGTVQVVDEPVRWNHKKWFRKLQLLLLNWLSHRAKRQLAAAGLGYNNYFVGFVNAGRLEPADLALALKLKQRFPAATIELGCHPGFEDATVHSRYHHWGYHWEREVKLLEGKI